MSYVNQNRWMPLLFGVAVAMGCAFIVWVWALAVQGVYV
jgi:hypothetical protein